MRYLLMSILSLAFASALLADVAKGSASNRAMPEMDMSGTDSHMTMRCKMMMQAAIAPTDPAAILAMKGDLHLTADQVNKLNAIAEKARAEAKGVLDEQQTKALKAIPSKPETSMAMHEYMMQMMHHMGESQDGHKMSMMNCPMMNMMMGHGMMGKGMMGGHGAATQPAQGDAGEDQSAHHHH